MNLANLIHTALLGLDNTQRQNAEQTILKTVQEDSPNFFMEASNIIAEESNQESLRQAAGALIKRFVTPDQNGQSFWNNVQDQNVKKQIKNNLLSTLMTQHINVKKAAANAISMICVLELPKNEWPDLILNLVNNLKNVNDEVKQASIITIGYICEALKTTNQQNQIDQNHIDNILFGILLAMSKDQQNVEIKHTAVKALHDSLNFLQSHIQKDEYRNYILQALYEVSRSDSQYTVISALQCLIDFCKLFYNYMYNNVVELLNFLQPLMLNDNEEIVIPATEIFNSLATEDKERKQGLVQAEGQRQFLNIIGQIHQALVPILLQNLLKQPENVDDGDLSIQDSSEKCLISVVEVVGDDCLNIFTSFISNTINHQQWQYRKAAAIAFGAMLDGPSKEKIVPMVLSALPKIVTLLQDQSDEVKIATSHTLNKVAEFHPECITENQQMAQIIQNLLAALQMNTKISRNICWCFNFLSDYVLNIDSELQKTHPFFQQLDNVLKCLIQNAFRQDITQQDLNIIDVSFMAVMGFIQSSKNVNLSQNYLKNCLDLFIQSQSMQSFKKPNIQMGLLSLVQSCILTLLDQYDDNQKPVTSYIDDVTAQLIYQTIENDFKLHKDVHADGIYVLSALATAIRQRFVIYLDQFYQYLIHALQKNNEIELMKIAIHGLADVSASVGSHFSQFLPEIIPALINCLKTPNFDREVKLTIYQCLGDIAIGCQTQTEKYLPDILGIFDLGFQAVCQLQSTGNQDSMDYADNLKETLLSAYMCIVHALSRTNFDQQLSICDQLLLRHFPNLIEFIQKSCDKTLHPTIEYMRNCLAIIADIANFYKNDVTQLVKTQFTQQLIFDLSKFIHNKENEQIIKYAVQVISQLQ